MPNERKEEPRQLGLRGSARGAGGMAYLMRPGSEIPPGVASVCVSTVMLVISLCANSGGVDVDVGCLWESGEVWSRR